MIVSTIEVIIFLAVMIIATFVTWNMMSHAYDYLDWTSVSANALAQRDQVMTIFQFLPLLAAGLGGTVYFYYRLSRRDTQQESASPDWM